MIQKLILRNFQNHAETTLELSPGINVIVGGSNEGKSAIVRALEWVRTNRPLGTAFTRHGAKDREVEVVCIPPGEKQGVSITRARGASGLNQYKVNNSTMKALGTDVPQVVADALRLGDINVQTQLSPHFLILDSPGAVARTINIAVHLEQMDECVAEGNKRVRALDSSVTVKTAQLVEWEQELEQFKDLNKLKKVLGKAKAQLKLVLDIRNEFNGLWDETELLVQAERMIAEAPNEETLNEALRLVNEVQALAPKVNGLQDLIVQHRNVGQEIRQGQTTAKDAQNAFDEYLSDAECPTCGRTFDDEARAFVKDGE